MHGLNEPNRIVVDPDKPPPKSPAEIAMLNIQHRCVGGVVKTVPADELPSNVCSSGDKVDKGDGKVDPDKNRRKGIGSASVENTDQQPPTPAEAPANKMGEIDPTDPSASDTKIRTSWCIPADSVDGMQVKLHNFGTAVLKKKNIEFWKKGYTFPNLPWNDDLTDVAIVLCGYVASHMATFDLRGRDLCTKMKNGYYQENPLHALRHPYFDDYLTKEQMPLAERNNYIYTPKPGCDCDKKKKARYALPGNDANKKAGREHFEDGLKLDTKMDNKAMPAKIASKKSRQQYMAAGHTPLRIKLMNLTKPGGESPLTPWIVQKRGAKLDVSVLVEWKPYKGSKYYNLLLDCGPNLNGTRGTDINQSNFLASVSATRDCGLFIYKNQTDPWESVNTANKDRDLFYKSR